MPTSTLVLILKALAPFLKELILKDKGFRDLVTGNKLASTLSGCLLVVLILFVYATDLADGYSSQINVLTAANKRLAEDNGKKQERIDFLEHRLLGTPIPSPPQVPVPEPEKTEQPPPIPAPEKPPEQKAVPPPPTVGPTSRGGKPPRKKDPDNLKAYAKELLDEL